MALGGAFGGADRPTDTGRIDGIEKSIGRVRQVTGVGCDVRRGHLPAILNALERDQGTVWCLSASTGRAHCRAPSRWIDRRLVRGEVIATAT